MRKIKHNKGNVVYLPRTALKKGEVKDVRRTQPGTQRTRSHSAMFGRSNAESSTIVQPQQILYGTKKSADKKKNNQRKQTAFTFLIFHPIKHPPESRV